MKRPTLSFAVVAALTLGACASTGHPVNSNGAPMLGQDDLAYESGGSAHRDPSTAAADTDREPSGLSRAERGIPTPQPARDPMGIPVPQPPIPAPDRGTIGYYNNGRY